MYGAVLYGAVDSAPFAILLTRRPAPSVQRFLAWSTPWRPAVDAPLFASPPMSAQPPPDNSDSAGAMPELVLELGDEVLEEADA